MNELQIFEKGSVKIRTVLIKNEVWFVGKDVCEHFGDADHKRSLSRIEDDEKILVEIVDSLGRVQKATAINESGLYNLLFNFQPEKSNKDGGAHITLQVQDRINKIKSFKKWVTSEVLPSIRKTGTYSTQLPQTFSEALRMLADTVEENEKQKAIIEEQKPAVAFFQKYVDTKNTQSIRDVAKIFNIKQSVFIEKLIKHGMLYRDKQKDLKPIAHYVDNGMIEIKTGYNDYVDKETGEAKQHVFIQTKLTPSGIGYISKLIDKNNF